MFNLTTSTMIETPIERVFDYMSTPENDVQWQYGILATAMIPSRHNRMGVYFRSIGHLMGRRNLGTYEVIEYIPNIQYKFKSLSGSLHLQTTYTFEIDGDRTRVTISIRIGAVTFLHMNEQVLGRRLKKQLRENLTALKEILELKQFPTLPEMNLSPI